METKEKHVKESSNWKKGSQPQQTQQLELYGSMESSLTTRDLSALTIFLQQQSKEQA